MPLMASEVDTIAMTSQISKSIIYIQYKLREEKLYKYLFELKYEMVNVLYKRALVICCFKISICKYQKIFINKNYNLKV